MLAIAWANSPWQHFYFSVFQEPIITNIYQYQFKTSINQIINEGLMTIFFLLVTLEVKRELIEGELNSRAKALLPIFAAIGGMVLPAAVYLVFNGHHSQAAQGWAIPTATDIAFSIAVLILLRPYVPPALKTFLTALAIIDDLGAIVIIAIFYTYSLNWIYFALAVAATLTLYSINRLGVTRFSIYLIMGAILWLFIFQSGIHTAIAGVILGFMIPIKSYSSHFSPLRKLEHALQPWVAYGILPLFALVNTGLAFSEIKLATLVHPVTLGIFFGLFVGKQLGITLASWVAVKLKLAELPQALNWCHIYGLSVICGIGFTMSLFIGDLSFGNQSTYYDTLVKLGVLSGTLVSGIIGSLVLWATSDLHCK